MQTLTFAPGARRLLKQRNALLFGLGLLLSVSSALAGVVGEVDFSRGVGMAYMDGQTPRMLGKGLALNEGDHLKTADTALAIIRLHDGTQMTLRPSTEIVIQTYRYREGASDNVMVIRLLEGGFRATTGRIPKDSPDAAQVVTALGTIRIRGTDFDARICGSECRAETRDMPEKARPNPVQASAKLVSVEGSVSALNETGERRQLAVGAAIFQSDTIETTAATSAILAFRDDSRLTLGANSRFKVDRYVFKEGSVGANTSLLSLVRGSMRALTGVIAKEKKENVSFKTPTATVGIRGTGLDLDCPATSEGCSFFNWLGSIAITPSDQTEPRVLVAGQGLFVSRTEIRPLSESTLQHLQRPDQVQVNIQQLFGASTLEEGTAGLYVLVRDGNIELSTVTGTLFLGRGETGFAGSNGEVIRPLLLPLFLEFDQTPFPDSANPLLVSVLNESKLRAAELCK